jgi:glycosyltransferase involved in cell wall biosynthesis
LVNESTGWGGTERYLHTLAQGLVELGDEVVVVTRTDHPEELPRFLDRFTSSGARVLVIESGAISGAPERVLRARRVLRSLKADVLHFNQQTPSSLAPEILSSAGVGGPARVATNHLPVLGIPPFNLAGSLLWRSARRALDLVITETPLDASTIAMSGQAPAARIRVVVHGVDTELFSPGPSALRAELGVTSDAVLVGCVGRLERQKRQDRLIMALPVLLSLGVHTELVIVGTGPLLGELKSLSGRCGVDDRVHFLGERDDVPNVLRALDVFALASDFEGLPLAILEAMAAGVAVVATRVGGVETAVRDGVNGRIVAANDPNGLVTALMHTLEERSALGRAAREIALSEFSLRRMVDQTRAVYVEALRPRLTSRGTRGPSG